MRICVIALYYSKNLGDAVIGDCVKAKLQEAFPDAEIDVRDLLARNAFAERKPVSLKDVRKTKIREKLRFAATRFSPADKEWEHEVSVTNRLIPEYRKWFAEGYDAAVFAGGQIFADTLALETAFLTKKFTERGIPVFFNACGTGSAYCRRITKALSAALRDPDVKLITVRDHPRQVRQTYGVKAAQVWDAGLWAPEVYGAVNGNAAEDAKKTGNTEAAGMEEGTESRKTITGLGIMYPYSLPEQKTRHFWLSMIRYLDQNNIPWTVFTNGAAMDETFATDILHRAEVFSPGAEKKRVQPPDQPGELAHTVSGFGGIISFRLHSHILAAAYDVPSVAVVWDDKVREFYRMCGHAERCFTISDRPEKIVEGLQRASREGWPRETIRKGRDASMRILTDQMRKTLDGDFRA